MRILHILSHVRQTGNGIVNVAVDLACLQAANHQVCVASIGGSYEDLLSHYDVQHIPLDQTRSPLCLLKAIWNYIQLIRRFKPDIVHAHMMTGVVLAHVLKWSGSYALVATVHNEFQRSSILMGWGDRVIAVSHAVAQAMMVRGIAPCKLKVVWNGTLGSPRTLPIQDYTPAVLQHPAIVTVCGMTVRKGIADLITAFEQVGSRLTDAHLYLVGDGGDRHQFEQQAQATSVSDRIHFEGFQHHPQAYFRSADIFVLASHDEPFGLVLSEAREAGCAIVASQVGGIPEVLEQGRAGLLVPPGSPEALASALVQLLTDESLISRLRSQAVQNLDWLQAEDMNRKTLGVYEELIK
ncbi:MAG: glycosyltransferase family 1 protein [Leptolyngbya sp. DLM2.Bin15]|nr:MAG: glycosyltransferase family 1 protein [Leptolyngbya sp. DLM2.Bin15]